MNKKEMQAKVNEVVIEMNLSSEVAKRHNTDKYGLLIQDTDKEISELQDRLTEIFKDEDIPKEPYQSLLEYIFDDMLYYSDEYTLCEDCHCIVEMPEYDYNYYKDSVLMKNEWGDLGYYCTTCLKEDYNLTLYIDQNKNNYKNWINMLSEDEMKGRGWITITQDLENGMYGVTIKPETIYNHYRPLYPEDKYDLVFVRTDENMFAVNFVLMVKEKEEE